MINKLSEERYEEIKQVVVKLFVDYGVSCVPVNGFELASKMGVTVVPYTALPLKDRPLLYKKSEDGFCVERENGKWYIFYNDAMEYGRINNTIRVFGDNRKPILDIDYGMHHGVKTLHVHYYNADGVRMDMDHVLTETDPLYKKYSKVFKGVKLHGN